MIMNIFYEKSTLKVLKRDHENGLLKIGGAYSGQDKTRFERCLADCMDDETRNISKTYLEKNSVQIDEITTRYLRHEGINPVFCAIIAYNTGPFSLGFKDDNGIVPFASVRDEGSYVWIDKNKGRVQWVCNEMSFKIAGLSETLASFIVGRKLNNVIDHPALREMDLTIVSRTDNRYRIKGTRLLKGKDLVDWL